MIKCQNRLCLSFCLLNIPPLYNYVQSLKVSYLLRGIYMEKKSWIVFGSLALSISWPSISCGSWDVCVWMKNPDARRLRVCDCESHIPATNPASGNCCPECMKLNRLHVEGRPTRYILLVFQKKDLYLIITQKLTFMKSGRFQVKSTQNLIKSDVSTKTLQFGGCRFQVQISWNPGS